MKVDPRFPYPQDKGNQVDPKPPMRVSLASVSDCGLGAQNPQPAQKPRPNIEPRKGYR
jgi:hypothetical protein